MHSAYRYFLVFNQASNNFFETPCTVFLVTFIHCYAVFSTHSIFCKFLNQFIPNFRQNCSFFCKQNKYLLTSAKVLAVRGINFKIRIKRIKSSYVSISYLHVLSMRRCNATKSMWFVRNLATFAEVKSFKRPSLERVHNNG